jgi:hypothetical protein
MRKRMEGMEGVTDDWINGASGKKDEEDLLFEAPEHLKVQYNDDISEEMTSC